MASTEHDLPFVVQEHHDNDGTHWDLMLYRPGLPAGQTAGEVDRDIKNLATWKLRVPPLPENLLIPQPAQALPDHRNAYLTYEGPIRNNRGSCKIFDRGRYQIIEKTPNLWRVSFQGTHLKGCFTLKKSADPDEWTLTKVD